MRVTSVQGYRFADVTVDLRRVEVRRGTDVVPLEPRCFDVLRHLLENRDRLVTKEELLEVVWKDTFVTPNVLTRAVAQLRKGLGDDASEARYIQTVARRGYRFIAPVVDDGGLPAGRTESPPTAWDHGPAGRRWWLPTVLAAAGAFAAAGLWLIVRHRVDPVSSAATVTPRRLTATNDAYGYPAISPDGGAVAYVSDRTGTDEIYVASLAPGSRELPITADGAGNVEPAFSPDGQWLAYRSRKRAGIWVVPSTGGAPRQVARFGSDPAWSPDSRSIVFTSRGASGSLSSQAVLWTVGRDADSPVQLTRLGGPPGGHLNPAWSPDGRLIAFRVGMHQANEIWIVTADGGAPWRVATLNRFAEPVFAPGGRAVYWVDSTSDRNDCLMRLKLDDGGRAEGDPERVLAFQGGGIQSLSIARTGAAVFLWSRLSVNLFAIDLGPGGAVGQPRQLTFDDDATNRYPHLGPDGRVVYEQAVTGRPTTAWLMDEDGKTREPLAAGLPAGVRAPQWDAGAKRIFAVIEPGSAEQAYYGWIDLATRRPTRIPIASSGMTNLPRLSPDGRLLAFHLVAADGVVNVWVQRLDDGTRRQVTFDREAVSYPYWSPDGRWLAVVIKRGEDAHVGVVSAAGGPVQQLTSGRGVRWPYSFSPDDEWVAFSGGLDGNDVWNVYAVSRSTKEVRQLTHFTTRSAATFPAWSPRGDRIVFARGHSTRSLWTLQLPP